MADEITLNEITPDTCFVPATHKGEGRRIAIAPGSTAARYLHYGRITIGDNDGPISFENNDHETGLVCLNGTAKLASGGETFELSRYDAVYIPRDSNIEVRANAAEGCDLAEVSAPVSQRYPIKFVAYAEVRQNPKLHLIAGKPPAERDLNVLIGANVDAGRIIAGVTFSTLGNWTSWPLHEHSRMLEEAYLFIDRPAPSFGVQFVYTNPESPELVQVVREGDCVLMPQGYHPKVAAPGRTDQFSLDDGGHQRRRRSPIRSRECTAGVRCRRFGTGSGGRKVGTTCPQIPNTTLKLRRPRRPETESVVTWTGQKFL